MTCNNCRWKIERKECPWDYDYQNTDYAEDCIDYRNVNSPETAFLDDDALTQKGRTK